MLQLLMKVPENDLGPTLWGMLATLCVTAVLLTWLVLRYWSRFSRRQMAAVVMQELLDREIPVEQAHDVVEGALAARPGFLAVWKQRLFGRPERLVSGARSG